MYREQRRDQLHGDRSAYLRLCFCIYKSMFSSNAAQLINSLMGLILESIVTNSAASLGSVGLVCIVCHSICNILE